MKLSRRSALGLMAALPMPALAQAFPDQPIRLIVPFPPGGPADIIGRLISRVMGDKLGKPVIVENRSGGGGLVGIEAVARSRPDGLTIGLASSGVLTVQPHLTQQMPFDALRDLAPIGMVISVPQILTVNPNLPVRDLREFIARAKAEPGKLSYGSAGIGSSLHMSMELLKQLSGIDVVHVPYRGAAPALQDVAGGRVELFITTPSSAIALVQGGRVKALAIASAQRAAGLPDVPTTAEAGLPGFTLDAWFGFAVPTATPKPIQERLNAVINAAAEQASVRERAQAGGATTKAMTLGELDALARREVEELGAVIRGAGITLE
jgi:tripartite-type tricarboxylate transporter receptor subunit TctC